MKLKLNVPAVTFSKRDNGVPYVAVTHKIVPNSEDAPKFIVEESVTNISTTTNPFFEDMMEVVLGNASVFFQKRFNLYDATSQIDYRSNEFVKHIVEEYQKASEQDVESESNSTTDSGV